MTTRTVTARRRGDPHHYVDGKTWKIQKKHETYTNIEENIKHGNKHIETYEKFKQKKNNMENIENIEYIYKYEKYTHNYENIKDIEHY